MLGAWRFLATLAAPLLRLHLRRRAARGKEEAARLPEREGHGAARPPGPLLWLHAASVGEARALLPLLEALAARAPTLVFLVTTGTTTSAAELPRWLSPALRGRVIHRYAPLDVPGWVARFLEGWRPALALRIEGELWPNTLAACAARGVPLVLVNARLSARSAARWGRFAPGLARRLLGLFALIVPRSAEDAARLKALGAPRLAPPGDLKLAAEPLPADPGALAALRAAIGGRPVWLAASTHPGEEALVLQAAALLRPRHPGLLAILAPRHPERGAELAALAPGAARRSQGAPPDAGGVYIADTMGELGLLYRLADVALVGGSLVPHGGQNPLEPARLGCPILLGPHMENFAEATALLERAGGARRVGADPAALAAAVADVLTRPEEAAAMAAAAAAAVSPARDLPGRLAEEVLALLGHGSDRAGPRAEKAEG
ncbi:3-deoxy-D-manno-octulosonic acid transferase [Rubritepida flocculans]|uniref:3-deoxy-D-manno-octulosonic acid transferase n=1 Tax=Rubritepida flocculans TaxID=182403 RepID=UPI000413CF21|nr:3-deoxy-D-manno-octulosonic acid transferase [Rubritepida flocculans]